MDVLAFFFFAAIPFVFLVFALREYPPGRENLKVFFYAVTFISFTLAAMMFVMHGEDGVTMRVFDPPSTVSTLTFRCDDPVQVSSTLNATGRLVAFPLPNLNFPAGNYAFDSVLTALCYNRSTVPTGLSDTSVYLKKPFDYAIQIPNTVDTAVNQITRNVQARGFEDFVSPYDERRESDIYFLIDNRGSFDVMFPIAFLYGGIGMTMLVFTVSEIVVIRFNRSVL